MSEFYVLHGNFIAMNDLSGIDFGTQIFRKYKGIKAQQEFVVICDLGPTPISWTVEVYAKLSIKRMRAEDGPRGEQITHWFIRRRRRMGRRQEMEHGDLSTRLAERHSVMPLQLSECFLVHVFQKSTI
jgi:hypothetical protein